MNERDTQQKISALRQKLEQKVQKFDRPVFGYTPPKIERKEGDEWTDSDGKLWTMKNGLIQSISKLQGYKRPWWCPKCSKAMNHRFDDKFYNRTGKCYNCNIDDDTKMMIDGTFEAMEKTRVRNNEISWLKDHISECKDYIRTFKTPQVHFENGGWEEIASIQQFTGLFNQIREEIALCEGRLKFLEDERAAEAQEEIQKELELKKIRSERRNSTENMYDTVESE